MSYPPQIERFQSALGSLPCVYDISSGIQSLQGITDTELRFPDFAALPIATLRRTLGGLEEEALVQFEFFLTPEQPAWQVLEFIAWFVRDQSRTGLAIQLRPFALPPEAAGQVQLGSSLRWQIDLFFQNVTDDLSLQLAQIDQMSQTLETAIEIYGHLLPNAHRG